MSETVTVKVSSEHPQSAPLCQTPGGSGRWGRYQFVFDAELQRCDYWIVMENLLHPETAACPASHTVLLTLEPPSIQLYPNRFIRQFGSLITCHPEIGHPRKRMTAQGQPWFVKRSYDQLKSVGPIEKTKMLSVISSSKQMTRMHRQRYEFALRLKDELGEAIDLFGRGHRDFDDKWDVLAPYKYSLALENETRDDYFTEKLTDCYLALAYPLYHGAPNIGRYFPHGALTALDINDFDAALRTIRQVTQDDGHYERHLPALHEARERCLDEHNIFAIMARHLDELPPPAPGRCSLRPRQAFDHKVRRAFIRLRKLTVARDQL